MHRHRTFPIHRHRTFPILFERRFSILEDKTNRTDLRSGGDTASVRTGASLRLDQELCAARRRRGGALPRDARGAADP
nr:MAG TPA: hypothetical protein [Caudoviricetes sp.]